MPKVTRRFQADAKIGLHEALGQAIACGAVVWKSFVNPSAPFGQYQRR